MEMMEITTRTGLARNTIRAWVRKLAAKAESQYRGLRQSRTPRFGFIPDLLAQIAWQILLALHRSNVNDGEFGCKKFQYIR